MGEYADMIIDGLVDQHTGEVIDGDAPGYPRCKPRTKHRGGVGESRCPKCGKRFKTTQGVADHTRDVHEGRGVNGRLLSREELNERDYDWANNQTTIGEEQDWGA